MNNKLLTGILVLLLIIAIGYIGITGYNRRMEKRNEEIFNEGALAGANQAMVEIFQLATACRQIPLTIQNQTINLVAVECLQAD